MKKKTQSYNIITYPWTLNQFIIMFSEIDLHLVKMVTYKSIFKLIKFHVTLPILNI